MHTRGQKFREQFRILPNTSCRHELKENYIYNIERYSNNLQITRKSYQFKNGRVLNGTSQKDIQEASKHLERDSTSVEHKVMQIKPLT